MLQVVITSYDMMMRLTCKGCRKGGPAAGAANACEGADHCMAARGFKACICFPACQHLP